jgi:SNF2 family DNA or RNA helicase
MDRDPWSWSTSDVTNFFMQRHADKAVAVEMPGVSLPSPEILTANFAEQEVTGAVLLCAIDAEFLRRRLKIKALGPRAAVLHCIEKLRAISPAYKRRNEPTVWAPPGGEPLQLSEEQIARLLELPDPIGPLRELLAAKALATTQATGEPMQLDEVQSTPAKETGPEPNVRPNEVLTESKNGRKRRRLDLTAAVTNGAARDTPKLNDMNKVARDKFELDDIKRLLPARKLPIDEIFFGDTALGEECGPMAIDHPLYVHEGSNDKDIDDQNFQYINHNLQVGAAGYISSKLRRFMNTQEEVTITRHQRHAAVMYPYRVGMQAQRTTAPHFDRRGRILFGGTRSAMVIQQRAVTGTGSDEPTYTATRENEALIESGAGDKGYNQEQAAELAGEHDHLLLRYPDNERDLMSEDDETLAGEDDDSTEFGDDQAEVDDEETILSSEVKDSIGRAIEAYIVGWQEETLPKLEAKRAWNVWKQTKHSKSLRDQLVQTARTRIRELETRLLKVRTDLERNSWESKASLDTMCACLQPTVVDIQHEYWKIEVWNRRQEPGRVRVTTRNTTNKHAVNASKQAQAVASLPMPIDDRLSVELRLQSSPPTVHVDDGGDHYHTPRGSPAPEMEDSPFIVPDDDMDVDVAESPQATGGADIEMAFAESPQATGGANDEHEDSEMIVTGSPSDQHAHSANDVSTMPTRRGGLPSMATPSSAARLQATISADMPSPSVLARRNQNKSSPTPPSPIDLTDLPSSPVEPAASARVKPKGKFPRKGRGTARNSQNAPSTSEADGWEYADLELNQDRNRLLIKLVRDMGPAKRNALWKTWQELMHKKFIVHLSAALDSIISREATPPADGTSQKNDNPRMQTMKHCARLLLAFHFCRSDVCRGDEELPKDLLSNENMPGQGDMKNFVPRLRENLEKRETSMYSSPVPVKYDEPILIESDDDLLGQDINSDHLKHERPESARKRRKVDVDLGAANKRAAARARLEESQKHLSSNPSAPHQMIFPDLNVHNPGSKVINHMRKPGQEPIYIEQKIAEAMKPYQLDGVQFLWRELTGDLEKAQGCLLAHTMGLGKTMQSIALLCAVDKTSQSSMNVMHQLPEDLRLGKDDRGKRSLRFLIICPSSLIQNWFRELKQWAHPNAFGGNITCIDTTVAGSGYIEKLQDWSKRGGILLIGYILFAKLVKRQPKEIPDDVPAAEKAAKSKDEIFNEDVETTRRILTQDAELIVADEAHSIKNPKTATAIAASKIRSTARIALTGTPMSNDVDEIYSIISWVTPGFLGDSRQFSHFFGLPIKEGLYLESTASEKRRSTIKLKGLHHEIEPKVHRAGIEVLKGELKPKVEFVLTVELTQQQSDAYAGTVAALLGPDCDLDNTSNTTLFSWFGVLGLLTAHPRCFRQKLLTSKDAAKPKKAKKAVGANKGQANDEDPEVGGANDEPPVPGEEDLFTLGFTRPIVDALIEGLTDSVDPTLSAKTRLLQEILRLSKKEGDKVLVFSARTPTLDYLANLFDQDKVRFVRIDGSVPMKDRTEMLAKFQSEDGGLDAMLISTRAGGQGLNIQSANRVIIFDFGFNPSWEEQAIGRAYRFGQDKPVFVYRFVAGGTYESNIYNTQMFKMALANRVVDKKNPNRNANRHTKQYLYPPKHVNHEDLTNELALDLDPKVLSKIMQAQIDRGNARDPSIDICTVRTMEVLQAEAEEAPLDEAELRQVEETKEFWTRSKMSGFRMTIPQEYAAMHANAAGIPSTAPAPGVNGAWRISSVPSATQAPTHCSPVPPPPPSLPGRPPQTGTGLGPRDIRNDSIAGSSRGPGLAGLPYLRPDG